MFHQTKTVFPFITSTLNTTFTDAHNFYIIYKHLLTIYFKCFDSILHNPTIIYICISALTRCQKKCQLYPMSTCSRLSCDHYLSCDTRRSRSPPDVLCMFKSPPDVLTTFTSQNVNIATWSLSITIDIMMSTANNHCNEINSLPVYDAPAISLHPIMDNHKSIIYMYYFCHDNDDIEGYLLLHSKQYLFQNKTNQTCHSL